MKKKIPVKKPPNILYVMIILAYILITTYTPNMEAFDSNAPKYFALSIINILALSIIFANKQFIKEPKSITFFLKTTIGLLYLSFVIVAIFSLIIGINKIESLLNITRIITVFFSVLALSVIIRKDFQHIRWITMLVTIMLIIDSISVYYYINEYILGRIDSILDIKSIYSNKNILASAIFIKIPAAIWLFIWGNNNGKWLGWIGIFMGILATLFLASRTFYIGIALISMFFIIFTIVWYYNKNIKLIIGNVSYYLLAITIAYLTFTVCQQSLYPEIKKDRYSQGISKQITTISSSESNASIRIEAWRRSWLMIQENPISGVGTGNWKIEVLKYENRENPNFAYLRRAHNDFIEVTAETGLLGGLLYLGIFIAIFLSFLRYLLISKIINIELFKGLFLATIGILCYLIDAFFNFPGSRPEILIIFSLYLGVAISSTSLLSGRTLFPSSLQNILNYIKLPYKLFLVILFSSLIAIIYISYLNFKSSKTQRLVFEEVISDKLKSSSDVIISGFPFIPNITSLGEPIKVQIARYLIKEGKYQNAIDLLRNDNSSPWDGRREYYLALAFNNLQQYDSSLIYSKEMYEIKPNYLNNLNLLSNNLNQRSDGELLNDFINLHISENINNNESWIFASNFYLDIGEIDKSWAIIEEAMEYFQNDSLVEMQYNFIYSRKFVDQYKDHATKALAYLNQGNFNSALNEINRFIENVPEVFVAHQIRANIYFQQGSFYNCIDEINYAVSLESNNIGPIINLRGLCYQALNDDDMACADFKKASSLGDQNAKSNYNQYCNK